jgi:hypothetical protein
MKDSSLKIVSLQYPQGGSGWRVQIETYVYYRPYSSYGKEVEYLLNCWSKGLTQDDRGYPLAAVL